MKKLNFSSWCMKSALALGASFIVASGLTSCNDDPFSPDNIKDEKMIGANVKFNNDPNFLSKFVSNYKDDTRALTRSFEQWSMPDLSALVADYTIGVDQNIDWNAGGNYVIPAGSSQSFNWITLNSNKGFSNLIIYGELTLNSIAMNGISKIYVAPGGKLTLRSEYCLDTSNKSLYIYNGGEYVGSYSVRNGAAIYVEGALIADGKQECGGKWYAGSSITVNGQLFSDNAKIQAPCMTINGDWYDQNNACNIDVEHFIDVKGDATFRCQSVVNTNCLMVEKKMELTNAVTLNVNSYIVANNVNIFASGWHINMGREALFDCGEKLFIQQNGGVNIAFNNDAASTSVIRAKEIEGNVQNFNNVPSLDFMCISGYVDLQYEKRNQTCQQIRSQETLTENGGVDIKADPNGCKPSAQGIGGGENPPLPPFISEVVAHIEGDHDHEISATCIALNGGKAYISWHKRGTSIHGCVEALKVENDKATLTSWMETETGTTQGGDNHSGNSAVEGADALGEVQGEYDFNHIIVVEEDGVKYAVTVGDNATKGGFIGTIALDANGDFGKNGAATETFMTRQLLAKEQRVGRSGNAVVRTNEGRYLIACAGGFQEYLGPISDLGVRVQSGKNDQWSWLTSLGDYTLTAGSAKHIALDPTGQFVATLEFTEQGSKEPEDNYWFNDETTVLPAVLKVRNVNGWLNNTLWSVNISGGISPIYGKNVVAMDANGNVYVSEGVNGLGIYNNGAKVGSFSIANYSAELGEMFKGAAVNGLAIDDQYIYLAYGIGGLWILDKNSLDVVSYYTKGRASANYVAVDGDYIYLAYGRNGVNVLKLNK